MATEDDCDEVVEQVMDVAGDKINDAIRFSQIQSRDMWLTLASEARDWANTITREMEDG